MFTPNPNDIRTLVAASCGQLTEAKATEELRRLHAKAHPPEPSPATAIDPAEPAPVEALTEAQPEAHDAEHSEG